MKYLIVGRSGTGKDTLARMLEQRGLNILKSYATRPKRSPTEDTHTFIDPSESKAKQVNCIAYTKIGEYEYFATEKQLEECDVYIIDPKGFYELIANRPDLSFHLVYMKSDTDIARNKAISRAVGYTVESYAPPSSLSDEELANLPEKETKEYDAYTIFEKRRADEDKQFSEFEKRLDEIINHNEMFSENCTILHTYTNKYVESDLENFASYLYGTKNQFDNLVYITNRCIDLNILRQGDIGTVAIAWIPEVDNEDENESATLDNAPKIETRYIPVELFADRLMGDTQSFERVMNAWLASDHLDDDI